MPDAERNGIAEPLLTAGEVAGKLSCSRTYAEMMFSAGRLGEIHVCEDGVRRVATSAVDAYIQARGPRPAGGIAALQQAALDAGMYDIPEESYAGLLREPVSPNQRS